MELGAAYDDEMADLLQSITRDIRHQKNDITQRHNSKLHHWIKKYNFPAYLLEAYLPQSPQGVVNLSDYVLPSADAEILSLGLKYRLPGPADIPRIIAGVEPALRGLNHQDTHRIRHFVTSTLQRPCNIPKPSLTMNRVISRLKRNRDIVITKSDKGSQTVILNTTVYKQKMQNVLDQHSIFSAITEQEHKTSVKNFRLLLLRLKRSQQITKEQYNDFTANLAQIAYIYGLPKIHKPDVPLRPIISYHLSPAYTLSKFLSNFLTPLLQSPPWEYTIANSPSFVSYITSLTPPPRSIMVSFDVTSLYLSLAHPLIINSLRTFLENAPLLDTLTAETVVELTSICLGMSTFTFDTQFFKQTKGSPMGSPLSTVVAEVVMRSLDQWITSRHSSDIFLWRRYIDDTFCLVSEVSASHILSDLNSFHPDIAFTHETENHSVLPFLDTLVIRTPSSFHTTVYYKNNTPPHHTNFRSHCPTPHKINTVRALTKRIFTHCSLPLFQTIEKAKIFSYLSKSGYPTPFILKHMHDPHHNSAPAIHRNICSLPFCPQSITIARFLRQHGITTYFQNPPNIATLIRHPITRSSLHASSLRSGGAVYSVSCDQCNATYVGETGMPSHRRSNLSQRSNSSRVQHAYRLRETRGQNIRRLRAQSARQAAVRSLETPDPIHSRLQAHSEIYSSTRRNTRKNIFFSSVWSSMENAGFNYSVADEYFKHPLISLGMMNTTCRFCGALRWKDESSGMSCSNGKVRLPLIDLPPEPLRSLLSGENSDSVHFLRNIRKYNSCFQIISFGAENQTHSVTFPTTFSIQGQVYHRIGSLMPSENQPSRFLQIYFMGNDDDDDIQTDRRCQQIQGVRPHVAQHNLLVQQFKTALENLPSYAYKVVVNADRTPPGQHPRRYNAPTANEVAIVLAGRSERLRYITLHQRNLRAESYIHLRDALSTYANINPNSLGQRIILPSSFVNSPRYLAEYTQDAFCYVRKFGRPDLFITFTSNPSWEELSAALLPGQKQLDRHDITARVFRQKLVKFIGALTKGQLYGATVTWMYSFEWQKRELPHAHILVWLANKLRPTQIDSVICAEFPDPIQDPLLYNIVVKNMIHGPCGEYNPVSPCMKNSSCSKKYPKQFLLETQTNVLQARILTGSFRGGEVLIPRIPIIPNDLPFKFRRLQFPVMVAFAMTINKYQGQTLQNGKEAKNDSECRKFKDQWNIQYFVIDSSNKALCLICNESIAVLKEYNMKRIVRTEKCEALKRGLKSQQSLFTKVKTEQEAATRASFRVALEIAKRGTPFTDGEMIKECIIAVVEEMCPEKVNLLKTVSMSANTVARRVENIAENISSQRFDKNGHVEWFSLALDESTDVSDTAQVLIYIRGVNKSYEVHEELLDISFGLNHRQFRQFIAEIGETDLPYYTAVRWLSCGKVLQRFFELRAVIEIFLNEKHRPLTELQNNAWLWKLAFYVDLTKHVNELNLRLQGENQHLPDLYTNIKSFRIKLILFQSQLRSKCFSHFNTCQIFSHTTETEFPIDFAIETLSALKINFDTRFSDFDAIANQIKIFQNPFDADIETLAPELQMEMIDLQCSDIIKNKYENSFLLEFYKSLPLTQFDNLHKFARGLFSVFGTTYLCEKTFSKMKYTKNVYRSKLTDEHLKSLLIIGTSKISPQLQTIVGGKSQLHTSH
ncbi:hypothetical protein LAZ67_16001943 [Cordylochernes scorpioides]|uniref:Reverse transcriptase domain-containing protein n=1 Tax=Cordylochernes scorpioides TaxID=51811 RepID=A0ABY6LEA6_9ARAC|nr:hypothetical protein LAZ67_16001943 [Cordylochernes scorpioides]